MVGAGSSVNVASGARIFSVFSDLAYANLEILNGNSFTTNNQNLNFLNTNIVNGVFNATGSQIWFRSDLTLGANSSFTGTGGGKVLFDGTTEIYGDFQNDGVFDLRGGDSILLGADATFSGVKDIMNLRNDTALEFEFCLLYTSPSPRDKRQSRMPSSA